MPTRLERLQRWDVTTFDRVASHRSSVGDALLPPLTTLADHSKLWIGLGAALGATGRPRWKRAAARGLGSVAVASLLANQVGKRFAPRDRPSRTNVPLSRIARRVPTSSSFPSGHSASAAAFALGVGLEAPEFAAPLAALAGAVCFSRVYTGVHYPGDVLAGAATGLVATALMTRLVPLPAEPWRDPPPPPAVEQPERPTGRGVVAVINPASGGGNGQGLIDHIKAVLPEARVVALAEGQDLLEALREAARHAEVLAVGGGDGSINAGATVAIEFGLPLLALPGGTLNHFAGDLGLRDADQAVGALKTGKAVRVAVGVVTSRPSMDAPPGPEQFFLNTASVGSYPAFVAARERWEGTLGKPLAAVLAVRHVLRTSEPLVLSLDGVMHRVGLMFVGANDYEPRGFAPRFRPSLDDDQLDIRLLDLRGRLPLARFALTLLLGRVRRSRQYFETHVPQAVIVLPEPGELARDGEIEPVEPVLAFSMRPDALTVFG